MPARVLVAPAAGRDAAALAPRLGGRLPAAAVDGGDARPALPASWPRVLQFLPSASGTPVAGRASACAMAADAVAKAATATSKTTTTTTTTRREEPQQQQQQQQQQPAVAVLADWTAKLLVLPFVGASLCGALTVLLGVHWVEAVRSQELVRGYGAPSLSALWALVPALSRPLPSRQLLDADAASDGGEGERRVQPRSPSARPAKRQRSGSASAADGADAALAPRQPKPRSPLTAVSPRPTAESSEPRRRRRRRRVFIWDLDETLVLFASLYTGAFAQTHGKEEAPGVALGEQMMAFLLAMLERHFFFGALHDTDVDHISCAEGDGCPNCRRARAGTAAGVQETGDAQAEAEDAREAERKTRYRRIRDIYEQRGRVDFLHDAQSEWFSARAALVQAIDAFSTGWLHEARQVLALIEAANRGGGLRRSASTVSLDDERSEEGEGEAASDTLPLQAEEEDEEDEEEDEEDEEEDEEEGEEDAVENVNVLVTNTQLVPALCKCLVYELDAFFPIDRVYSSAKVHKYRCFEAVMAKYRQEAGAGRDEDVAVDFVAIGDGLEEEQVSLALGLEFHKIRSLADLRRLRYDLQLVARAPSGSTPSIAPPMGSAGSVNRQAPAERTLMPVAVDTQEQ